MKYKMCLLVATAFAAATLNAGAADGAALYTKKCVACHGKDGKGTTSMGKKLKVKDMTVTKPSEAAIIKAIKEGVTEGGKLTMKPVKGLSDDDAKAIAAYVKGLK
ncbi:MAG: cytochrome c [Akkermansiaceae bacterium]|nr:cytochrome c [Akkermansiaceae bacterium]